jgi:hypothetical protein
MRSHVVAGFSFSAVVAAKVEEGVVAPISVGLPKFLIQQVLLENRKKMHVA